MRNRRAHRVHLVAIGITALISAAYLVVDVYDGSGPGQTVVQANGTWVIALLLVALAVVVALTGRTALLSAAAAVTLFALITGFTICMPCLLAGALMWAAGAIRRAPARPGIS